MRRPQNPPSPTYVSGRMAWSAAGNTPACSCHPPPRRIPSHSHGEEVLRLCCFPPSKNQHPTFTSSQPPSWPAGTFPIGHNNPNTGPRGFPSALSPRSPPRSPPNERRSARLALVVAPKMAIGEADARPEKVSFRSPPSIR
jgi:hypothetical protein